MSRQAARAALVVTQENPILSGWVKVAERHPGQTGQSNKKQTENWDAKEPPQDLRGILEVDAQQRRSPQQDHQQEHRQQHVNDLGQFRSS